MKLRNFTLAGFSMVETLISVAISGSLLGSVALSTAAFNRMFNATHESFKAVSDQMRVLDYIARDLRCATSGSVSGNGAILTLNLPDYLDYTNADKPVPRTPVISAAGTVSYGATPIVIVYKMNPSNPQHIIRTETMPGKATTSVTLSTDIVNFQMTSYDPSNPNTTNFTFDSTSARDAVSTSISFTRRYQRGTSQGNSRAGTVVKSTTAARNHK
jgi:Tfp pilus assembly protein PilW